MIPLSKISEKIKTEKGHFLYTDLKTRSLTLRHLQGQMTWLGQGNKNSKIKQEILSMYKAHLHLPGTTENWAFKNKMNIKQMGDF